jgi:hypothetical protein
MRRYNVEISAAHTHDSKSHAEAPKVQDGTIALTEWSQLIVSALLGAILALGVQALLQARQNKFNVERERVQRNYALAQSRHDALLPCINALKTSAGYLYERLKGLCLTGRQILSLHSKKLDSLPNPLKQHKLTLWIPELKKVFEALEWQWDAASTDAPILPEVELFIQDLEEIDAGSDGFRYPVWTDGKSVLPENFLVHTQAASSCMDAILDALDTCHCGFSAELSQLRDWAAVQAEQERDWSSDVEHERP